jgi:hypothetical protein
MSAPWRRTDYATASMKRPWVGLLTLRAGVGAEAINATVLAPWTFIWLRTCDWTAMLTASAVAAGVLAMSTGEYRPPRRRLEGARRESSGGTQR